MSKIYKDTLPETYEKMDDHLGIYIFLKYGKNYNQLFTVKELLVKLNGFYSRSFTEEELHELFTKLGKPKTRLVVHRLYEMGFSPKTIQNWLEISQSTVSIHLSKPVKENEAYRNYKLLEYYNHKIILLRNMGNEYNF
jgi:DNA-binding transcriptional ArsR family regulator